tara:strand:- start:1739 stop:2515 length:777 start_codon:yes stop_codon:yes gene_type:complete
MLLKQQFNSKNLSLEDLEISFNNFSAIQLTNLFSKTLCEDAFDFILKNESQIIDDFKKDKRGMVVDKINEKEYIKYFDKPLSCNYKLFSKFITSEIFCISKTLLKEDVYLQSFEIHSRCAHGTPIPAHQDNAYFGLNRGSSLTFYISLNKQSPHLGGLKYYKIPVGSDLKHESSNQPGFSLTVKDRDFKKLSIFEPSFEPGDSTVHHSTSLHFAEEVPENTERVIVVRLSLHSIKDFVKPGHFEWYEDMVKRNRDQSQ